MEEPSRRTGLLVVAVVAAAVATVVALVLVTLMLVDTTPEEPRETQPETRPLPTQPTIDPIRTALESHPGVVGEMIGRRQPRGVFLCGYDLLGREGDTLYLWVGCGDFSTGPQAELLSGSAEPARATIAGDTLTSITFPSQESIAEDIHRLFPADLAEAAIVGDGRVHPAPSMEELLVEASASG